jgi:hypothetical protein
MRAELFKAKVPQQIRGAAQQRLTVIQVVPIQVAVGVVATGSGLTYLPRAAYEGHLAMAGQMFFQHGVVEARSEYHDDQFRKHRKLVKTILRHMRKWSRQRLYRFELV